MNGEVDIVRLALCAIHDACVPAREALEALAIATARYKAADGRAWEVVLDINVDSAGMKACDACYEPARLPDIMAALQALDT